VSQVTRELFFSFHLSIIRNLPATCASPSISAMWSSRRATS